MLLDHRLVSLRQAPPSSACTRPTGVQGKRDHVLLERAGEVLAGVDEIPLPIDAENEDPAVLDIGWEAGQLLATDCYGPSAPPTRSSS